MSAFLEEDPGRAFLDLCRTTFRTLETETDLSPRNPKINSSLAAFVGAVLDMSSRSGVSSPLQDPFLRRMRPALLQKLSRAEYEMERHFGGIFAARTSLTPGDLDEFWYRQCYRDLVAQEVSTMRKAGLPAGPDARIVFVGSGPLPLTAIDLHLETGARVACVDSDPEAVRLSRKMVRNAGLSGKIDIHHAAGEVFDYRGSDVVFIASLVGQKTGVVSKIRRSAPEAHLAVRSVEGVKALLYAPVDPADIAAGGYAYRDKSEDGPNTINTTLFFSPRPRAAAAPRPGFPAFSLPRP